MSDEAMQIRVLQRPECMTLKAAVRAYLGEALSCSAHSEQVWLVLLSLDGAVRGRVCCYVGERANAPGYSRRMTLAMLQSGARRFATVHYFPEADKEGEIVACIVARGLQNVEALLDFQIDDHFVVTDQGENAWWRSLVRPN